MKAVKNIALAALSIGLVGTSMHIHNDHEKIHKLKAKLKQEEGVNLNLKREKIKQNLLIKQQENKIKSITKTINLQKKDIEKLKEQLTQVKRENQNLILKINNNENATLKDSNDYSSYYIVTAYSPNVESTGKNPGNPQYKITASGAKVQEGVTVACPRSMPFGTKLKIEGLGYRTCQDRGGAIVEGRIDVYMDSTSKAQQFGKQRLKVEILN
ncbi:3D domain-containing protein [Bacillus smithii]|uniref:3D domain-containing protein n=1 Tax=Bacillus smithii TaxID=1479 RepID=UPI002E22F0B5|nr:3D domain-containing protein [Bacillus smithii]MED4928237.1 3D domain-containing protein [Bacillus smithii]